MKYLISVFMFIIPAFIKAQDLPFHGEVIDLLNAAKYDSALLLLDKQLFYKPNDQYSYLLRARAHENLYHTDEAITDYNIYLEYVPEDVEARFSRGVLLFETDKIQQAIEDFQYIRKHPSTPGTTTVYFQVANDSYSKNQIFTAHGGILSRVYYYLGLCFLENNNTHISINYLDSALLLSADNPNFLTSRGLAKEKSGDINAAIIDYKSAINKQPGHVLARYNLSLLLANHQADVNLKDSLSTIINEEVLLPYPFAQRGYLLYKEGFYKDALADFNTAIMLDAENPEYLLNRAKTLIKLKEWDRAMDDLTQALSLKNGYAEAYFNLAVIAHKKSQFKEAINFLDLAIFYDPDYKLAYINRAIACFSLEDYANACKNLKKAIELGYEADPAMLDNFCIN